MVLFCCYCLQPMGMNVTNGNIFSITVTIFESILFCFRAFLNQNLSTNFYQEMKRQKEIEKNMMLIPLYVCMRQMQ